MTREKATQHNKLTTNTKNDIAHFSNKASPYSIDKIEKATKIRHEHTKQQTLCAAAGIESDVRDNTSELQRPPRLIGQPEITVAGTCGRAVTAVSVNLWSSP